VNAPALASRIDLLAADVGRLRRRVDPESSLVHLADRLASHIEALYVMVEPTAGELVAWTSPGDEQAAAAAIAHVDARWNRLRGVLGKTAA